VSFRELEELFASVAAPRRRGSHPGFIPAVDVFRTESPPQLVVTADLAGIDQGDLELTVADGVLSITGLRRRPHVGRAVYQQMEIDYGPFERRVPLGDDVDARAAIAELERGLLTVRLPFRREPQRSVRVVIAVVRRQ
jgi:HSP20 family protein